MADQASSASGSAPGKRSRGRPLKNATDEEESATKRRARVRKAQQAFQKRRQAATRSLEDRLAAIQNGLEQFSTDFSAFTTAFTQSSVADTSPALLVQLRGLTEQLLSVARIASPESPHESDEATQPTTQGESFGTDLLTSVGGAAQRQPLSNSVSPGVEHLFLSDAEPTISRATSEDDVQVRYTLVDHSREHQYVPPMTAPGKMTPTSGYFTDLSDLQYLRALYHAADPRFQSARLCWQGCPCSETG